MLAEYIMQLYKQYCNSIGIIPDLNDLELMPKEFIDWVLKRRKITKIYGEYVEYLGISSNDKSIAEVDKGCYDTISNDEIEMISPFSLIKPNNKSQLIVLGNSPIIVKQKKFIRPTEIDMFLTHNPYDEHLILGWDRIHNFGQGDICVGVCGNLYDKDKAFKMEMLERLFEKLDDDKDKSYDEFGDIYFYNIKSTKRSSKILEKVLRRF